ncbi:unnamed protein product [Pseudo-nitzschia multistriata]|uniref:DUF4174 domain-containing protein n=1 Tax=Pseudo-nitzschia multistriata TaxID=183589 RepID=A0A448ZL39_9STRA|nr:unnamed protein product [Pseudo-nitzschia multistriata]
MRRLLSCLFLRRSILAWLIIFYSANERCYSFQYPARQNLRHQHQHSNPHQTRHLRAVSPMKSPGDLLPSDTTVFERRIFLSNIISGAASGVGAGAMSSLLLTGRAPVASAATTDVIAPGTIKVTPIAHTFITSSSMPKPIRENDATRLFTNARVVYIFEGENQESSGSLLQDVVDLTKTRKAERGAGVTPGEVQLLLLQSKGKPVGSELANQVAGKARAMPDGDVLLVGPISSGGTAADGKILADTAAALDTFVGCRREKGVVSVLLNGPKENLKLVESGFPASDLLWYGLPSKN